MPALCSYLCRFYKDLNRGPKDLVQPLNCYKIFNSHPTKYLSSGVCMRTFTVAVLISLGDSLLLLTYLLLLLLLNLKRKFQIEKSTGYFWKFLSFLLGDLLLVYMYRILYILTSLWWISFDCTFPGIWQNNQTVGGVSS